MVKVLVYNDCEKLAVLTKNRRSLAGAKEFCTKRGSRFETICPKNECRRASVSPEVSQRGRLIQLKMKKVNLLSKAEMRKVMGGSDGFEVEIAPNCTSKCTKDSDCSGGDNTCKTCAKGSILKGTCITSE